jgi:hypothetical protein
MAAPPLSDAAAREAITAVAKHGTIRAAALALNLPYMTLKNRLDTAERRGLALDAPLAVPTRGAEQCPMTLEWPVLDGVFAAFSDAHWTRVTQARSVAHEALLRALPDIKPDYLLSGGDLMDFGGIGRHDPIGWENRPKVREEIEAAQRHLSDMRDLAPSAMCFWTRGNHDDRLESFLARHADPMRGMPGTTLAEAFPDWRQAWRFDFSAFQVMHNWHGGIHAAWNNVVKGGVNIITGHTHALEVRPFRDLRERRYGVQLGMLGDPNWPCFAYGKALPRQWTPGWAVLTVRNGKLLAPELCEVVDGAAWFRGARLG